MIQRTGISLGTALLITCGLLFLMQTLISVDRRALHVSPPTRWVEFVHVAEPPLVHTREPPITRPEDPDDMPATPPIAMTDAGPDGWSQEFDPGALDLPGQQSDWPVLSDGGRLAITTVAPIYPRRALTQGLIGWVILEYRVTASGAVRDPMVVGNCAVAAKSAADGRCEAHPNPVFDRAAIDAALKFRYKPKVVDGVAVETIGVRNLFTFELEDG